MLCVIAPVILIIRIEIFSLNKKIRKIMVSRAKNPPEKLRVPAIGPLVRSTKSDLSKTSSIVLFLFIKKRAYMMAMFDNPSFMPGGSPGSGGKRDSRICSVSMRASKMPMSVSFCVCWRVFSMVFSPISG